MKKGFTIVETLVAVTVLMIAISGPLTVSFRALNAATSSKNQMIATFLAQDAVEYARNVKDNNVVDSMNLEGWLNRIGDCEISKMCSANTLNSVLKAECDSFTSQSCKLHKDTAGRYTHSSSGSTIPTPFFRTMYIQNIQPVSDDRETAELVVDVVWATGENVLASTTIRTKLYDIAK